VIRTRISSFAKKTKQNKKTKKLMTWHGIHRKNYSLDSERPGLDRSSSKCWNIIVMIRKYSL